MPRINVIVAIIAIVFSLAADRAAIAQTSEDELPPHTLLVNLEESRELYVAKKLQIIRKYGKDRLRLDQAAVDRAAAPALAQYRANFITNHLRKDTDGDGRISIDEARASARKSALSSRGNLTKQEFLDQIEGYARQSMRLDANGDGYISVDELMVAARRNYPPRRSPDYRTARSVLAIDPNKDGVLTLQELKTLAHNTFDRFDRNGNGWIDFDEKAEVQVAKSDAWKRQHEQDRKDRRERSRNRGTR